MIDRRTKGTVRDDCLLGMGAPITRRDFLNGALLGAGAALARAAEPVKVLAKSNNWDGYGGVGDYASSHGNTEEVIRVAHEIRDGRYDQPPPNAMVTGELFDLVVVGGGLSGLAAAYYFRKQRESGQSCLILDNHPIFGGESKRNEFLVRGQRLIGPQGANEFDIPQTGEDGFELYDELAIPRNFQYAPWSPRFKKLEFDRTNYGFQLWVDEAPSFGTYFDRDLASRKPCWVSDPVGEPAERRSLARVL